MRAWTGFAVAALALGVNSSAASIQVAPSPISASGKDDTAWVLSRPAEVPEGEAPPSRFELDCKESWRTVHDPSDGYSRGSTTPPGGWDFGDRNRYLIDLDAMRYCAADNCTENGPGRIVSWNSERIVLDDQTSGPTWYFFKVDRHDATIEMRITQDDGFMRLLTGVCRYEPFSGFPPRRDNEGGERSSSWDGGD